ncbi:MAG: helix-turn-helix domain-containing protein [Pyrinomonadaceae bacterium]
MTFGRIIAEARKKASLTQRELAVLLKKEDGQPITPQYLNDIEHGKRNPPSDHLMKQLAKYLGLELDYLYACSGELPQDLRGPRVDKTKLVAGFAAIRKSLKES